SNALCRMTIARPYASLAERLRYLERELILARGRPAVRHLDLVDQLEHRHALGRLVRRHLEGWPPVPPEVDRVKEVPERVCHDHEPTYLVQHMPQLHRPPDPRHVAVQPDHDHVSHVRRDFHPAAYEQPAPLAELLQWVRLPHDPLTARPARDRNRQDIRRKRLPAIASIGTQRGRGSTQTRPARKHSSYANRLSLCHAVPLQQPRWC